MTRLVSFAAFARDADGTPRHRSRWWKISLERGRGVDVKVYTNHLGKGGVDHVEVAAPMGVTFEIDGSTFDVVEDKRGGLSVRLVNGPGTVLSIDPHAGNSITVRVRP